jgi:adenosyl cobinamide kinase/adenosyl cobinamide phosphate guanylyltransferase
MGTRTRLAPASIQQSRFLRHRVGFSIEEIARRDGVSQRTVERSIQRVDAFRQANSVEFVNEALSNSVMKHKQDMDRSIANALRAQRQVKDQKTGEIKTVPDHQVRLEAINKLIDIAKTVQPKAGHVIKVNVGVGVGVRPSESQYVGFEDRIERIRESMAAPAQIEGSPEAGDASGGPDRRSP